jgi:dTDP-4-dehydrorhamnose 3,5-epimerase
MRFTETILKGAFVVEQEPIADNRGFFARSFCQNEFAAKGLKTHILQSNLSFNKQRGTLRGMHFQRQPHAEAKLVSCTAGAIHDVIIDLRQGSPTFTQWVAVELSADNRKSLYIPEGFAHGFQALTDNAEVSYQMFNLFSPAHAGGVRWNDNAFKIEWPIDVTVISEKDQSYADYDGVPL